MKTLFDISLINCRIVDPINQRDGGYNIGTTDGKIAEITKDSVNSRSKTVIDMAGYVALPGLIDIHTHLTSLFGGSNGGLQMLAKAGICTALDLAGPSAELFATMKEYGSGINVATLESIRPGENVSTGRLQRSAFDAFFAKAIENGAIGGKLLGGHFPLTPENSRDFVVAGREQGAYIAWHAGTTETCNTVGSLEELLGLSGNHFVHVAHINSYCRGETADILDEVRGAFRLLGLHPNAYSEAYLAETNGTVFWLDEAGHMKSRSTGRILVRHGYSDSVDGLEKAFRDGFAKVFAPSGLETVSVYGEEAIKLWRENGFRANGGFDVNPAISRLNLCMAKYPNNDFIIDAISTDGGAIPRNVIVSHGLALVAIGALTLPEFVRKASYNPSRMLCLPQKGHLGLGADADITVVDLERRCPVLTMVNGKVCMFKGYVSGTGGTVLTTQRGKAAASQYGLPIKVIDVSAGPLTFRKPR